MMKIFKKWIDIVTIINGKNQKEVANPQGRYPIYGSGGIIGYADDFLCEAGTTIVGRKGTINSPIFVNERFWNVDTAFGICPGSELVPKYLFYFCQSFNFKALDKSTTIPSLAKRDLLNIEMPVPPLDEQRHIAAQIEKLFSKLDAGVESLQKVKKQLAVYRQTVLNEAFKGDYQLKPLAEISKIISGYAFKSKLYDSNGEYVVIKIGNVKQYTFDFSRDLTRTNEMSEIIRDKYLLRRGDCLITLTGSRGKRDYGYVSMIKEQDNYVLNQRVAALRFNPTIAVPEFYQYYLSSDEYRDKFFSYETGNVGQGNVGVKALLEPLVKVPSLEQQNKIANDIEHKLFVCDSIEKTVATTLQQAESMRQSILKNAFEGRL